MMPYKKNLDAQFWNNIAVSFSSHFRNEIVSSCHRYEYLNLLKRWGGEVENKKILVTDLFNDAFQRDEFLSWLTEVNKNVVGIDISEVILTRARQCNKNLKYCVVCDVRRLPFKETSFNLIIAPSTLDHFSRLDLEKSLIEIRKTLAFKGSLIVTLHNKLNIFLYFILSRYFKKMPFPMECYSAGEIKKLLISKGFNIINSTAIVHLLFPGTLIRFISLTQNNKLISNFIREHIHSFNRLGILPTKYLTGKLIAIEAVKL